MNWLVVSLLASVVLTVLLNAVIRIWPGATQRSAERLEEWTRDREAGAADRRPGRVRVIVPWKGMLIASILLTLLLNVLLRVV